MRLRGLWPAVVYLLIVAAPCAAAEYPVDQWRTWLARASDRCPQQTWIEFIPGKQWHSRHEPSEAPDD